MGLRAPSRRRAAWLSSCAALMAAIVFAGPVQGQAGAVTGTVVDKSGRSPLNGVQVSIDGTGRGTVTDARGRYTIPGVPPGAVTVRATMIGFRTEMKQAQVAAGGTATVDFELGMSAISLRSEEHTS